MGAEKLLNLLTPQNLKKIRKSNNFLISYFLKNSSTTRKNFEK